MLKRSAYRRSLQSSLFSDVLTHSHCSYFLFFFFCDSLHLFFFFFFQAEDGIRDPLVTGVQTCALPISAAMSIDWADPGYVDGAYGRVRPSGSAQSIDIAAGQRVNDVTIALWKFAVVRSEERRVGKECRCRWRADD